MGVTVGVGVIVGVNVSVGVGVGLGVNVGGVVEVGVLVLVGVAPPSGVWVGKFGVGVNVLVIRIVGVGVGAGVSVGVGVSVKVGVEVGVPPSQHSLWRDMHFIQVGCSVSTGVQSAPSHIWPYTGTQPRAGPSHRNPKRCGVGVAPPLGVAVTSCASCVGHPGGIGSVKSRAGCDGSFAPPGVSSV